MNALAVCRAPFPVCPACERGVRLPPFAEGCECQVGCCCGHEFTFAGSCGQPAQAVTSAPLSGVNDEWLRLGVQVLCYGHAHILTSRHLGQMTSLS